MRYKSPMVYFIEALGYMGFNQVEVDTDKPRNTWPELKAREFTLVRELQETGINWCITFGADQGFGELWFNFDKDGVYLSNGCLEVRS